MTQWHQRANEGFDICSFALMIMLLENLLLGFHLLQTEPHALLPVGLALFTEAEVARFK